MIIYDLKATSVSALGMRFSTKTRRNNKNRKRQFLRNQNPAFKALKKALGYALFGVKPTDEAEERFALAMAKNN